MTWILALKRDGIIDTLRHWMPKTQPLAKLIMYWGLCSFSPSWLMLQWLISKHLTPENSSKGSISSPQILIQFSEKLSEHHGALAQELLLPMIACLALSFGYLYGIGKLTQWVIPKIYARFSTDTVSVSIQKPPTLTAEGF
ncbi:MAG: hypothetical protein K2X66_02045 [Cyanobacteria bacterium]|nr:hypothetical protein [Cyanobacteriota bacterium]